MKPTKSLDALKNKGGKKKSRKQNFDVETFGEDPMPQAQAGPTVSWMAAPFLILGAIVTLPCRLYNGDSICGELSQVLCGNTSNTVPTRRVQDVDDKVSRFLQDSQNIQQSK